MTKQNKELRIKQALDVLAVLLIILAVHYVVGAFNGKWPWSANAYNSYLLQALSWLEGRLDLGQNYEYLELAVFQDKYYVSFPPFPSYVLLPFACFLKEQTPEGWIAFFAMLLGAFYALRIAWHYLGTGGKAVFWTCFLYVGTNVLYITLDAGVWFIAQSFALTLSLMAIFYAIKGKGGWSLFFWGCSVGCRPLQVLYFPLLFYTLYKGLKKKNPQQNLLSMIKEKFYWAVPVCLIAFSYMVLNYARFGNPIEFGHNYLPEFTREEYGQFNIHYVANNIKSLFRLPIPSDTGNGTLVFYKFDGNNIFLVMPLFVSYLIYFVRKWITKQKMDPVFLFGVPVLVILHIVGLCAHRTMGGFHFGHRYIIDVLPYIYWNILLFARTKFDEVAEDLEEAPICDIATANNNCTTAYAETMITNNDTTTTPEAVSEDPIAQPDTTSAACSDADADNEPEPVADATIPATVSTEGTENPVLTEHNKTNAKEATEAITSADFTYCLHYGLCALGFALNLVGTIVTNMNWA